MINLAMFVYYALGVIARASAARSRHAAHSWRVRIALGQTLPPCSESLRYCLPSQVAHSAQQCPRIHASKARRSPSFASPPDAPMISASSVLGQLGFVAAQRAHFPQAVPSSHAPLHCICSMFNPFQKSALAVRRPTRQSSRPAAIMPRQAAHFSRWASSGG